MHGIRLDAYIEAAEPGGDIEVDSEIYEEKAIEIAKQLLDVLDVSTIAEKTGLSEEKVNQLKGDL